jgi:hypothetical protein
MGQCHQLSDNVPQSLPPMGQVDFPENACIVPEKTDEDFPALELPVYSE